MKTVFVSSTFKDMQSERDAIRETTAPLLNAEARTYGDEIDFCDLRWGIDTAELETDIGSRKVLEVCLDEIDRCKPPMIVLLGYRYGWIPNKSLIEDAATRKNRQLEAKSLQQMQLEDLEMSVTALEIEYGSLRDSDRFSNTLFYFREIEGDVPADYQSEDAEHAKKIKALKERIRAIGGGKIKTYTLHWNGSGFDGVDAFARILSNDIKNLLLPEWEEQKNLSPFDREHRAHQTFIVEKSAMFRARMAEADMLFKRINSEPVTIIKGAVGSGKSTLFCHLAQRFQEENEWTVLPFISGLTSNSNDAYDIIENTVYYIEEQLHLDHYIEETDRTDQRIIHTVDEWRSRLEEMCALFTKTGKKLLIMLDAADQLTQSEARDELYFIPMNIGANIHFVMTCTPDLKTTGRRCYTLKSIDEAGKRDVIAGTLGRAGRELSKSVIKKMIALKSSDNPLYLSLIVQRLLMMNSADFSEINKAGGSMAAIENYQLKLISENCPDDLDKMSAALLTEAGNRINPALVSKAGQLLAVSRAGLRARDLSVMLGDDWTDIDFAHFISYMNDCFMQRDDGRYDFTHKSIRAGFLRLCPDIDTINKQILTYMKGLPDDDPVRISEIIYHAIRADDKEFFVDYVIDNEYNKSIIGQASLDTYEKCMSDGGEWIVSVLHWLSSCLFDDGREYDNVSYFANFELMKCFKGSQRELEIQLLILKENVSYAEKLNININNNDTKRSLSVSYERVAGIYEKLGGRENLERALGLYSKGLELAEKLAAELGTADSRRDLWLSYEIVTRIYELLGGRENLERALVLYNKALKLSEQLVTELGTVDSRGDLSMSYSEVANIYEQLGGRENLECALRMYNKCLEMSEQLTAELGTADSRRNLLLSYNRVADIYAKFGGHENLEHALGLYNKGLKMSEQLAAELGTADSRRDLSISYERVANIYEKLGEWENLERALGLYNKCLEMREQLAAELGTVESRRDLSVSYNKVAGIYEKLGGWENLECALGLYNKCLEMCEQLDTELGIADSRRNLSVSYNKVADTYAELGGRENLERALGLYNKCLEMREQLAAELDTVDSRGDLSVSYNKVAGIYEKLGGCENLERALGLYNKCLEMCEQLAAEHGTADSRVNLSVSYNKVAGIYEKLGGCENLERALELYNKFLELSEQLAAELSTVDAFDHLAVSLFEVAMHEMTPVNDKKSLLERGLKISQMLLDATQMDRYQTFVDVFTNKLQKL